MTGGSASRIGFLAFALIALPFLLVDCSPPVGEPLPRPVRAVTVERATGYAFASLTGRVAAAHQVNLSFQLGGRVVEVTVGIGDHVSSGQLIARVDPRDQRNAVASAEATLAAARSHLLVARSAFERQNALIKEGATSRSQYDQAHDEYQNAQGQMLSEQAALRNAQDALGYDELRSDADGIVTARGAEPGEVVQPGQMIVQLAQDGGMDAVFDVSDDAIRNVPSNLDVQVALVDNPNIRAIGHVREIAPQADQDTRTYVVKVGLAGQPAAMHLGSTVTGQVRLPTGPGFSIPASALTEIDNRPAVWIVRGPRREVELRTVRISRYDQGYVRITQGLSIGDLVVTAGVQELHPGQTVRVLDGGA